MLVTTQVQTVFTRLFVGSGKSLLSSKKYTFINSYLTDLESLEIFTHFERILCILVYMTKPNVKVTVRPLVQGQLSHKYS